MERFFFERGLVILRQGRTLEFRQRGDTTLHFEETDTGSLEPIEEAQFWRELECQDLSVVGGAASSDTELEVPDPTSTQMLPIKVDKKHEDLHLKKLQYVRGMERRGITQGRIPPIEEAIAEIALEINDPKPPRPQTVCEWMRKLTRAHGDVYVLMPKAATGWRRENRIDADHERFIERIIDDHYLVLHGGAATNVYEDHYLPKLKKWNEERSRIALPAFEPISSRTFLRRIEELDKYDVAVARLGRQEARRRFRMSKGHMWADHPLDYVEIDHAKLRLWVIDDALLLPLGRPWITAVRDRMSRMLLGFYVSFRGPSLASTFSAIRHSVTPHTDLQKMWPDLEHPWIAFGPGLTYVSDRGLDFLSDRYRLAIFRLGGDVLYCESHTPWHKPHIERFFLSLNADLLETVPGQVFKGLPYSKDYNPKEDAVVRFSTLCYLLVKWAVDYQPFTPNRTNLARPIDLWRDGIGEAPVGHLPNTDALRIILGLEHKGTLGHEGIRFKHLQYANDELEALMRNVGKRKTEVKFVVAEENLGRIHVAHPRTGQWLEVECTRHDYAEGLSLYQHQQITRKAITDLRNVNSVDQLLRVRLEIQERIANDIAHRDTATKTNIARYAGIDSSAVFKGRSRTLADFATPSNSGRPAEGRIIVPDAPFTDVPTFSWSVV